MVLRRAKALCLEGAVIPGGHVIVGVARKPGGEPVTIFEIGYGGEIHVLIANSGIEGSWEGQRELIERLIPDLEERVFVGLALLECGEALVRSMKAMASGGGSPPSGPSSSP